MTITSVTVLVVEDDRQIRRVVEGYLEQAGLRVLSAADGISGLALAQREKPALIVLDLMLPGLDGWEITRRLRHEPDPTLANVYILMLTARVDEADRVKGLTIGADDYVIKPFSPRELVARVQAALRRLQQLPVENPVLVTGGLRLDPAYRRVTLDDQPIPLTAVEFDLLHHFMRNPDRPFSRDELLNVIQSANESASEVFDRTVDAHIKNLRHKLGGSGRQSRFIETVHGVGYRFSA